MEGQGESCFGKRQDPSFLGASFCHKQNQLMSLCYCCMPEPGQLGLGSENCTADPGEEGVNGARFCMRSLSIAKQFMSSLHSLCVIVPNSSFLFLQMISERVRDCLAYGHTANQPARTGISAKMTQYCPYRRNPTTAQCSPSLEEASALCY